MPTKPLKPPHTDLHFDIAVIGGGPAGMSAAISAARMGMRVCLIAERMGGQLRDAAWIENAILTPHISGNALADSLRAQLVQWRVSLKPHVRVEGLVDGDSKTLKLSTGEQLQADAVVLATGARWRELDIADAAQYVGRGLAYCPHCDGPAFAGQAVAVIGGGDKGLRAAIDLAYIAESVTVLERGERLRAEPGLIARVQERANIRVHLGAEPRRILSLQGRISALAYAQSAQPELQQIDVTGVFVQIGLRPNSELAASLLACNAAAEVVVDAHGRSSVAGVFACGDVSDGPHKQVVVAAGDGSKAALSACAYLRCR